VACRSGGSRRISHGALGHGAPVQWSARAGTGYSSPVGARVLEEGGVAAQMQSVIGKPDGARKEVHIVEEKVLVVLSKEGEQETCHWVLDTGASNQMSGCQAAFSSIDGGTVGTMKFIDGSVVNIEGVGTIIFECKTGEHCALTSMYFIPWLTTSIISVGQLDESGYEVKIKGNVMSLRDESGLQGFNAAREGCTH
jgi:hypothetical protein